MTHGALSHIESLAAHILTVAFGQPLRLTYASYIPQRTDICRFRVLDAPPIAPSSVVVKGVAPFDGSSAAPSHTARQRRVFYTEWAGLTLLQEVMPDSPLAPRVYGGDDATGILVMEDLGARLTLWNQLESRDPQGATTQLVGLATALGRMHTQTIGHQARFERLCAMLEPDNPPQKVEQYAWIEPTVEAIAAALGLALVPTVRHDLALLKQLLTNPELFWAYTQGDPSPGNCLFVAPTMRLLDFGVGAYRHAFVDFPPPWCWQRIPLPVMHKMIDAYQIALAPHCTAAADPVRFAYGLVEGCAYWSMTLLKDWPLAEIAANAGMRRNLLYVLERFVECSQQTTHVEALGAMVAAIARAIRKRWPVNTSQPSYYAAFQEYA